jgi:hypothetical protein
MKILIVNDTSRISHMGCQAVMSAFRDLTKNHNVDFIPMNSFGLKWKGMWKGIGSEKDLVDGLSARVKEKILWSDIVIVNGEGSIHHNAHMGDLAALSLANKMGKKTWLVNTVFQKVDGFHETLNEIDKFIVRDRYSYDYAKTITDRVEEMPDIFWNHSMKISGGNQIYVTDYHCRPDVGAVLNKFREKYQSINLGSGWGRDWKQKVEIQINDAGLIITGRHHGVYLAAKLGVPFIAMGSNTYKVEGIIKSSGCNVPFCKTSEDVKFAMKKIDSYDFDGFTKFLNETYKYPELFETLEESWKKP